MTSNNSNEILPWFKACYEKLCLANASDRLAHGILISAPEGSGKRLFADYLIKSLLCENSKKQLAPFCSSCKSCLLIQANSHPDYYLLDCLIDNKGKQKKSIGIDQVRQLTLKLTEMPQLGGWRIALISSVSALTTASFNALLKSLEEPNQKTLLLLLTDNLQTVPATVRSRCQLIQPDLNVEQIKQWLLVHSEKNEVEITQALNSCFNAPLKAIDYLESNTGEKEQSFYLLCDQLLTNQITPQELAEAIPFSVEETWLLFASYIHKVQLAILTGEGIKQYQLLPVKLPSLIYAKIADYHRGQFAGSNLQPNLQLQAILILWFEEGRKITNYINKINR